MFFVEHSPQWTSMNPKFLHKVLLWSTSYNITASSSHTNCDVIDWLRTWKHPRWRQSRHIDVLAINTLIMCFIRHKNDS